MNPVSECPGVIAFDDATHSMADPSVELLLPVIVCAQPLGSCTAVGAEGRKSSPGTHPNQKVPMFVVPVSLTVML